MLLIRITDSEQYYTALDDHGLGSICCVELEAVGGPVLYIRAFIYVLYTGCASLVLSKLEIWLSDVNNLKSRPRPMVHFPSPGS